ncbi:hypothetical protein U1Q18_002200 [Sarracenia purpurea var. burkii]
MRARLLRLPIAAWDISGLILEDSKVYLFASLEDPHTSISPHCFSGYLGELQFLFLWWEDTTLATLETCPNLLATMVSFPKPCAAMVS